MSVFKHWYNVCIVVAFCLCGVAGQAYTQSVTLQPPSMHLTDENGVDLIAGSLAISIPGISAGGGGSGISQQGSGYNLPYGDNMTGVLNTGNDAIRGIFTTVTLGGSSEKFFGSGTSFTSETGTPNTFSCASNTCTYTMADGTIAQFDQTMTSNIGIKASAGAVTQITKPDGEVLKFYYKRVTTTTYITPIAQYATLMGLKAVKSSLGWMVKYELSTGTYAITPTKVYIINTSIDYCDPTLEGACASMSNSASWPTMLISSSGSTATYTQILNAATQTGPVTTLTTASDSSAISVTYAKSVTGPTGVSLASTSTGIKVGTVTKAGQTWTYVYGTMTTPLGVSASTTRATDPMGGVRIVAYDTNSRVLYDRDEMGRITQYGYDSSGRITKVLHPDVVMSGTTPTGGYTLYTYNTYGNLTDITEYGKDGTSTLISHADYPDHLACNTKTCNKPTSVTAPATVSGTPATMTSTYTYDSNNGNVLTESKPAVGGVTPQVRYTYTQITPKNMVTTASPGTLASDVPVWRLTSASTCMSSNWTGSACAAGGADEVKTTMAYNTNNVFPTSTTRATGNGAASVTTTIAYDSRGCVISVDGPISGADDTTYSFCDLLGRNVGVIGKSGQSGRKAAQVTYNNSGQVIRQASGSTPATGINAAALAAMAVKDSIETTFNGITGLPVVIKHNVGASNTTQNIVETSYDNLFRVQCSVTRMNGTVTNSPCVLSSGSATDRIVKTNYNSASQIISTVSGYGTSNARQNFVKFYNQNGTLASVSDDKGQTTGFTYDTFNRLIKTCYPSKTSAGTISTDCQQTGYTGALVTSITLRDGTVETLTYDSTGRLSGRTGTGIAEAIAYNNFNQVISHTNNGFTETFAYHALWGMTSDVQPMGAITYTYDAFGRRSQLNYPSYGGATFSVAYGYFNDDTLQSEAVTYNGGSIVTQVALSEDSYGRLSSISRGPTNVVVSTPTYSTTNGLLSQLNNNLSGTSYDSILNYSYNSANQIISRSQTGSGTYNYNPAANITTNYTSNGQNQVTAANATSFAYDSRGNLSNDGAFTYTFNKDNFLTATSGGASLAYDASNRLVSVVKSGVTTNFLYDGADLIAEYNGATLLRRFVHGSAVDQPLVWYEGTDVSTARYFTADQQGSITAVTDSSGNAIAAYAYNEYGLPIQTLGSVASRFQYTGQVWLPEVGLYNYKSRLYAPSIGRFMQTDPIGYGDGLNWYGYVHGDPVNSKDSTGLSCSFENHSVDSIDSSGVVTHLYNYVLTYGNDCGAGGGQISLWDINPGCQNGSINCANGVDTNYHLNRPKSHNYKKQIDKCSALQIEAERLADTFDYVSSQMGWAAFAGAGVTALSGLGEVPSAGTDTPLTVASGAFTYYAGVSSYVTGGIGASLRSFAQGNNQVLTKFTLVQLTSLGAGKAIGSLPGGEKFGDLIGGSVEKALGLIASAQKEGCTD